jgi:serine/threonine protein kinase
VGDSITKNNSLAGANSPKVYACKVVERSELCNTKESLIVSEIQNQDSVASKYVTKMRKAIKTDSRYYIFMEYCNGSDLKEVMELKKFRVEPEIIQKIMFQLVHGFFDMMAVLVIHRDLKLQNIMLHFPDMTDKLLAMSKEEKRNFLRTVDLTKVNFEIKIADFGFSKKLKSKGQINKTICGTPLYMAP